VVLGRKNWLFAGSDDGGERAAAIYTILGTAKLNDLNPQSYLHHILERIADHPVNRIGELLPWNVAAEMPQMRLAAPASSKSKSWRLRVSRSNDSDMRSRLVACAG
jgi:transposase